ncbi:MAG: O-antigen ligase family protein [Deltaproteobacteria bacterium]|nr:O-antigen ligase family protein [Deltaproteobacteria bacterium]
MNEDTSHRVFPLLACALVLLRVAQVGHAPDEADVVVAGLAALLWWRGGSRSVDVAVAALLFGALVAVPWSRDPWVSFLSLPLVAGVGACLAAGTVVTLRRGQWTGLALGGALHGLACAAQRFVIWPDALARRAELELDAAIIERMSSLRPIGLSISPDLAAAVGVAGVVGALALVVDGGLPVLSRRFAGLLGGLALMGLLLSRSFGAVLAVAAGVVVFALLSRSMRALLVLGVCGLGAAVAVAGRGLSALTSSAHERVENWRIALQAFVDAPIVGQGFNRFAPAYLERRGPDDNVTRYAHSMPLQWLAETGIVGAIALVVVVAVVWRLACSGAMTLQRRVLLGGSTALLARGLIDYDFEVGQTAMLGALVLGTALAAEEPKKTGSKAVVVVAVVVAVCALALIARAVSPALVLRFDAETALRAVAEEGAPAEPTLLPFVDRLPPAALMVARERLAHDDVEGARAAMAQALARDPGNASALRLAVVLARAGYGDVDAALAAAARWHVALPMTPAPVVDDETR